MHFLGFYAPNCARKSGSHSQLSDERERRAMLKSMPFARFFYEFSGGRLTGNPSDVGLPRSLTIPGFEALS